MLTSAVNTTLQKHNPPNGIFNHQFMISNCVYDSMKIKHAHIHTQRQLNFKHLSHNTKFSEQQDKTMNHRSPNELSLGCQQRELRGEIRLLALCSYFTEVILLPCSQIQKVLIYVCSADQAGIFTSQQKFFFCFSCWKYQFRRQIRQKFQLSFSVFPVHYCSSMPTIFQFAQQVIMALWFS